jgi:hypothetical protein
MKRLTVLGLGLLLATGAGATLADGGRHDDHHGDDHRGNYGKGHDNGNHNGHGNSSYKNYNKGYNMGHSYHVYYHGYPRVYYYPRPNYDRYYYYPLGAALIGSAVNYSLYHTHDGARCYENHQTSSYSPAGADPEVVGCHRIERYPDGTERRVDVPLSECY